MMVDTGILYALVDRRDRHHKSAREIFCRSEPKIVPEAVVVESDWLICERLGVDVEVQFLAGLKEPVLTLEASLAIDRARAAEIVDRYRNLNIGYVDAVVVAMAERLRETVIATLDRRHFEVIRPRHVDHFEIIP